MTAALESPPVELPPRPPLPAPPTTAPDEPRPTPDRFSARELLLTMRPHQWVKNALVLVAPVASAAVLHVPALLATLIAVLAFCAASATTYLVNDIADVDADRLHPTKQLRPIAAGTLSVADARTAALLLGCSTFGLAVGLGWSFVGVLAVYLATTTCYSRWLKHIPIVDVITVAAGFVLRIVAGAVAVGVGVSWWLLGAVAAGALLISLGKRDAEVGRLGADAGSHRAVLDWYRPARTNALMVASEIGAVLSVGVWFLTSFGVSVAIAGSVVVAVILGRFRRLVLAGQVDDPVRVVGHDRPIAIACAILGCILFAGAT